MGFSASTNRSFLRRLVVHVFPARARRCAAAVICSPVWKSPYSVQRLDICATGQTHKQTAGVLARWYVCREICKKFAELVKENYRSDPPGDIRWIWNTRCPYETSVQLHQLYVHLIFITYLCHIPATRFDVSHIIFRENLRNRYSKTTCLYKVIFYEFIVQVTVQRDKFL